MVGPVDLEEPVTKALCSLAALALSLAVACPAAARQGAPDVQQFKPVTGVHGFMLVHDARLQGVFQPAVSVSLNYAVNPLEVQGQDYSRQFGLVDGIFGVDITGAIGLLPFLDVGLDLPILQVPVLTDFISQNVIGGRRVAASLGDIRLEARVRVLDPDKKPIGLAFRPFIFFPTGDERAGLGRGNFAGGAAVIVSQSWTRFRFAANAGYGIYPRGDVASLSTGDEIFFSVGGGFSPIVDKLDVNVELDGSLTPGLAGADRDGRERFGDPAHTPVELLVSARYRFPFGLSVGGGVGKGLSAGFGSPDVRFFATAAMAFSITPDKDKDGIKNKDDACPEEPEDFDEFEDADGCPDPDNDGDQIADVEDACPDAPEDFDEFEDADGCPELDNDGDGIEDTEDSCPMDAEDVDTYEDEDGCPDVDNDADGILDVDDNCPLDPEDMDDWEDDDGCPEDTDEPKLAYIEGDRIVITEKVYFATGKASVLRRSLGVVAAVAAVLSDHPEIKKVEVGGHTDSVGSRRSNERLSAKRAAAVADKLVVFGVGEDRLVSKGYGESSPIADNDTDEGKEQNRRVEFSILEQEQVLIPVEVGTGDEPVDSDAAVEPGGSPWGDGGDSEATVAPADEQPWGGAGEEAGDGSVKPAGETVWGGEDESSVQPAEEPVWGSGDDSTTVEPAGEAAWGESSAEQPAAEEDQPATEEAPTEEQPAAEEPAEEEEPAIDLGFLNDVDIWGGDSSDEDTE